MSEKAYSIVRILLRGLSGFLFILFGLIPSMPVHSASIGNGDAAMGSIAVVGEVDSWTFNANAGDSIHFQIGEISGVGFEPQLRLIDPNGVQVTSNFGTDSADVFHQARISGIYTVEVLDASTPPNGTGNYRVYLAKAAGNYMVPGGDQGGGLSNGGIHPGSIDLGDLDIWSFDAEAMDWVHVQIGETADGGGFDPQIILYGPLGEQIATNWGTSAADIAFQAPSTGTYTVIVKEASNTVPATGAYNLYLANVGQSLVVPGGDEGGPLTNGGIHAGSIALGDVDGWTFSANASDSVHIQVGETADGGGFDPQIILYGPLGEQIATNWGTSAADIAFQAPSTGTYTVIVKEASNTVPATGAYNLYLANVGQSLVVPEGDEGGPLTNGGIHAGSIALGDVDGWTFSANASDSVHIQVGETADGGGFDPQIILYGPLGEQIATNWGTSAADIAFQAPSTGTYTVIVKEASNTVPATGAYNLYLANVGQSLVVPAGDQGGALTNAGNHPGTIDLADLDTWTFSANALDSIELQIDEIVDDGGFDPQIVLYDPTGDQLASVWGTNTATIQVFATVQGNYTVVVKEASNTVPSTGTYALNFNLTPNSVSVPTGTTIASLENGAVESGDLTAPADMDQYDLTVAAGDRVRLKLGDVQNSGNFSPLLQVFSSGGSLVASNTGPTVAEVQFPVASNDTLTVVASNTTGAMGSYQYALHTAISRQSFTTPGGDEGGPLSNGGVASGLVTVGDMDLYSLSVSVGDRVRLKLGDENNNGNFFPAIQVFASSGSLIASGSSATIAEVAFDSVANDTLTVLVRNDGAGIGIHNYALHTAISQQSFTTPGSDEGGPLSNGGVASGLVTVGDMDLYSLSVSVGDRVRLKLGDENNNGNFFPAIQVFASSGSLIAFGSSATVAEVVFDSVANDTLTVLVRNDGAGIGIHNYALHTAISQQSFTTPGSDEGGPLSNGGVASGLVTVGDMDLYSLSVSVGDRVRLKLGDEDNNGNFFPAIQVFASNGSLIASGSSATIAEVAFDSVANDTLTVLVRNDGSAAGSYNYVVHSTASRQGFVVPTGDEGGVLANAVAVAGILTEADLDVFSLSVMPGDTITVEVVDAGNSGNLNPAFSVHAADGSQIALVSDPVSAEATFTASSAEALKIIVRNQTAHTGDYNYSITVNGATIASDTDGDGLNDTDEVANGTNINVADTDGDGLTDGDEVNNFGTDPHQEDSDGDGFTDLAEVNAGTDPLDPNSIPSSQTVPVPIPQWAALLLAAMLSLFACRILRSQIRRSNQWDGFF